MKRKIRRKKKRLFEKVGLERLLSQISRVLNIFTNFVDGVTSSVGNISTKDKVSNILITWPEKTMFPRHYLNQLVT